MNGKVARMIRKFRGNRKDRKQWNTFPSSLREKLRAEFNDDAKLIFRRPKSWPMENR